MARVHQVHRDRKKKSSHLRAQARMGNLSGPGELISKIERMEDGGWVYNKLAVPTTTATATAMIYEVEKIWDEGTLQGYQASK